MKRKLAMGGFKYSIFFLFFAALLLMCGIHTGFLIAAIKYNWPTLVQTLLPILYWGLIAAALTAYVQGSVRRNYEIPFRRVSEAAEKVAGGDFSVRLPAFESSEIAEQLNKLSADFNKMVEDLAGVETLRTDFIANVSHELKTPLAVMQNYGTMLQQPGLPEEQRVEYARAITAASRRLSDMITNILRLNKLENQTLYPNLGTYNLGEQLCECLLDFEELWGEKRLDIRTDIQENVFIEADPELLSLVWNNLFSNAMKFTPPGGSVSLSLKADESYATVTVSDTGCGISPDAGKHIFEKFYQGDTSHAGSGNGLGLALVKRVIDITGSDINVSSEVGKGSTFAVRLRRKPDGET